jgi:hypothetical protein
MLPPPSGRGIAWDLGGGIEPESGGGAAELLTTGRAAVIAVEERGS